VTLGVRARNMVYDSGAPAGAGGNDPYHVHDREEGEDDDVVERVRSTSGVGRR
jgi:hypothetical protein